MSSQSTENETFDDQDDTCSCDTYSSGWERSSTSDYFDSTDTEEIEEFCAKGEFYSQPKRTGKPTLFDMEYKCELVVLPNPYKKEIKKEEESYIARQAPDVENFIKPEPILNPWKKIEEPPIHDNHDPWKFLDVIKKNQEKKPPVQEPRKEEKKKPQHTPRVIDNSNTNKLCKYKDECRMNKNNKCSMVHSLAEWRPRVCRFNNGCKRKTLCGYYHTDTPPNEYLKIMMKTQESIYAKNSALYEKYLL
jgi:hypothetical protein